MFPLSLKMYAYAAVLVLLVALSLALKIQTSRLATSKAETVAVQAAFDLFKAEVKQLGEKQEAATKAHEAADKLAKEKADRDNTKAKSDLAGAYAAYRSLRDQRGNSGSSIVPAAAPGSASPERACFDRTALDSAISGFDRGVTGILEKGDAALTDLGTARAWAQGR